MTEKAKRTGWMMAKQGSMAPAGVSRREWLRGMAGAAVVMATAKRGLAEVRSRYDVRSFGATGDGTTLDTAAVQRAIDAAAADGGGTVSFAAGTYACFTLRLRSRVTLELLPGSVLLAATPEFGVAGRQYDAPEMQPAAIVPYQDYGHNHWHNSLLWGEGLEQVGIVGEGLIWGRGLVKGDGAKEEQVGAGNKILALKNCRNVLLRDVSMLEGGHFAILASGVDNLTIDNLKIDTNRDGMDIDCCRNVHVSNCTVNSPWDDGIVIKTSYSLGEARPTEQVTIDNCIVTGSYQMGSLLDGSYKPFPAVMTSDWPAHTGRIKIGTETNGDVRNVVVSNCVLQGCNGLAVESEDGGRVEDVRFVNITMRDLYGPPFFVRLGSRMRGPAGVPVGTIQRVAFDAISCWNAKAEDCSVLSGVPGHPIRDVSFTDVTIEHEGGGAVRVGAVPELETAYPDPQMFGATPAQGFFVRHVEGLRMAGVQVRSAKADARPLFVLEDVRHVRVTGLEGDGAVLGRGVEDVSVVDADGKAVAVGAYLP
jgi:polygalacturonase